MDAQHRAIYGDSGKREPNEGILQPEQKKGKASNSIPRGAYYQLSDSQTSWIPGRFCLSRR